MWRGSDVFDSELLIWLRRASAADQQEVKAASENSRQLCSITA